MSILAIFGPTASGKSAVAAAIAERIPAELVAADSMQAYRGLPVLTNQSPAHLVGIWPLDHEGSVGEYQRLAHETIDRILSEGRTPVVVGGTGLYFRAALAELELPPAPDPGVRERFERLYDELGPAGAHDELARRDPAAAAVVHANDRRRIVRALELADLGVSLAPGDSGLWSEQTRHPTVIFGLEVDPDELERRIEARTRAMFDQGVEDEVRRALAGSVSSTAREMHGFREVAELPPAEAYEALVVLTRRYAAYQRKWMRRIPRLIPLDANRPAHEVAGEILARTGAADPSGGLARST